MKQHGKFIAAEMHAVGQSVKQGQLPLYMLSVVIMLAVLREGSEIVLFLYGILVAGQVTIMDLISGSLLGLAVGVLTGLIMYLGLARVPVKQLFSVSSLLLTFLAAGMVAKGIGHLVSAGFLPPLVNPLWDTSFILSQHSLVGRFLSTLIGYQDHPSGIQVLFYMITLALIGKVSRSRAFTRDDE